MITAPWASPAPRWVEAGEIRPYPAPGFDRPLEASRLAVGHDDVMVTDECCGLLLPAIAGLDTRFGPDGTVHRFCSTACAWSWEQHQRGEADAIGVP
jgi:hypothetical protein